MGMQKIRECRKLGNAEEINKPRYKNRGARMKIPNKNLSIPISWKIKYHVSCRFIKNSTGKEYFGNISKLII